MDLNRIVMPLSQVPGVQAVVLGGSQSRGEATAQSDYDIGVYYDATALDAARLAHCLRELDDGRRERLLNPPGEWGPWINGGAWLVVGGTPVDILLRDTGRVREVLEDCVAGRITIDYQCGHPFGFTNLIYAAEVHYCMPLWQGEGAVISALKAMLDADGGYPAEMKQAAVRRFLWEAWFSLACVRKPALAGEMNYAMGSVFRAVCAWAEVLYALNGKYLMNEKGALKHIDKLPLRPDGLERRVRKVYGLLAVGEPGQALEILDGLHGEIERFTAEIPAIVTPIR